VKPPGDDVTVKLVAREPFGVNATVALVALAPLAIPIVGADGGVVGKV
jgi:hypothetical protein